MADYRWQQIANQMSRGLPGTAASPFGQVPAAMAYAKPGPYRTNLTPFQEMQFQDWVKAAKIPFDDSPTSDYDMRGFYQAALAGDPNARTSLSGFDGKIHFTDTYKTPYHKTFSNESKYATPDAPKWVGDTLVNKAGQVIADERTRTARAQAHFFDDMSNK